MRKKKKIERKAKASLLAQPCLLSFCVAASDTGLLGWFRGLHTQSPYHLRYLKWNGEVRWKHPGGNVLSWGSQGSFHLHLKAALTQFNASFSLALVKKASPGLLTVTLGLHKKTEQEVHRFSLLCLESLLKGNCKNGHGAKWGSWRVQASNDREVLSLKVTNLFTQEIGGALNKFIDR